MAIITKTIKVSGGDYENLTDWFAAEATDLVASGDQHVLEIYDGVYGGNDGSLETSLILTDAGGWNTSPTNNITIRAAAGEGHGGVPGVGATLSHRANAQSYCLRQSAGIDITLENLSFDTYVGGGNASILHTGTARMFITDCIFTVKSGSNGISVSSYGGGGVDVDNCAFFSDVDITGANRQAIGLTTSTTALSNIRNCGVYGGHSGGVRLVLPNKAIVTNMTSVGLDECYGGDPAQYQAGSSNNASTDATAPGDNPQINISTDTGVDFVDYAAGNYMPAEGGKLLDMGINNGLTTDITGFERVLPYDIGPYEAQEGVPALPKCEITLTDASGNLSASLSGLKWAWFDQVTPDLFATPTDQGSTGSTDLSGVFSQDLSGTALTVGQTGWLTITDSTGSAGFDHNGFSGPVVIS